MYYFKIQLSDHVAIIKPTLEMAESMYKLILENKAYIGEFLDFVDNVEKNGIQGQRDFLMMRFKQEAEGSARQFLITYDDEIVGSIDLHNIIEDFKRAEVGYWLSPLFASKGVMSLAIQAVLSVAFVDMNLNKVLLMADVDNLASNRVAQKNHFILEGTHRKDVPLRGEYRDINVYGILQSDFVANKK